MSQSMTAAMTPLYIKNLIVASIDADKGEQIETIDLTDQSSITDYMVIASGRSSRQVSALAQRLVERLTALGLKNVRAEGAAFGDWVIVDAGDVIVHLFRPEVREFYSIEKMWRADAFMNVTVVNAHH